MTSASQWWLAPRPITAHRAQREFAVSVAVWERILPLGADVIQLWRCPQKARGNCEHINFWMAFLLRK